MPKRKNDMQKIIVNILVESKKQGLPYLTHKQLVNMIKKIKPRLPDLPQKVSQGLYLLQIKPHTQKPRWDMPKIIKVKRNGQVLGYTVDRIF